MTSEQPTMIDWGLKPLHVKQLEILKDFHRLCTENRLEYCLGYGSVLGAVRHNGFIPWDDDVDLYMMIDDYRKFKMLFKENDEFHEKYVLQEFDKADDLFSYAKIRINNTTYIEPLYASSDIHQGIYVDIFILHYAPESKMKRQIMYLSNQYLTLKGLSNRRYKRKKLFRPLLALMRLFPEDFLRKQALAQINKYDHLNSGCLFDPDERSYKKSFYLKDIIYPTQLHIFEGLEFRIPRKPEMYLNLLYGDYNSIPSIESIQLSQHAAIWDVNKDYSEYINKQMKK